MGLCELRLVLWSATCSTGSTGIGLDCCRDCITSLEQALVYQSAQLYGVCCRRDAEYDMLHQKLFYDLKRSGPRVVELS